MPGRAFEFFFWLYLDTESEMRRWDGVASVRSTARVSEARWFFTGCIKTETSFSLWKGMIGQRTRTRPRNDGTRFSSGISLNTESYIANHSPPRTRSNSEMFSYWVYKDWNIIFITKVILISRDPDDTESGRTVHTFSLVIRIHGQNQEYNQTEKVKAHFAARSSPPQL